ncbi:TRAP transporter substrate-binding protein [Azospirillum sp. RWY-5-1]|uniref:TRAP transporter substrate-binding protein n=1 Tax=Azospirillum oleiclasticum TaxID=2735135 RepID=A0ABX2TDJ6_9PROT|nr:TRAP transporter substrate-binding protein [Azospirillum oleiclasticum]NYZ13807.1 TRAP transporter substrate-binding protein [Azospirillum oleiclasticum]NYZ21079.1 TRAP transporter substrate-binding protein [Azospirillum oleiclasticum]
MRMTALAGVLALGLAGTAAAQDRWEMPTPYPDGNYQTQNIRTFADDVKAATNGGLVIRVHSNASLFKLPEIKRAVQTGQVQAGEILLSTLSNEDPMFEADAVPFLASSFDDAAKLYTATKPFVEERLKRSGLRLLFSVPWPGQSIYSKTPVNGAADFKGVRFRAFNSTTSRLAELLGAIPATVQVAEVPQAFSTGIIQAMITSPATGVDAQAWDFVKHYYDVRAFLPKSVVFVNERAFARLPADAQAAVLKAAADAEARGWATARAVNDELINTLRKHGMQIHQPGPVFAKELATIGSTMRTEWLARVGGDGAKVIEALQKN